MKAARFIFIVSAFVLRSAPICEAQTNSHTAPPQFKTVLATNWVKPGESLRVVNGQLYNTAYSKLWMYVGPPNPWWDYQVEWLEGGGMVVGIYAADNSGGRNFKNYIMVYHHPKQKILKTGENLPGCKAMAVDNYVLKNGESIGAFDCGVQSTNFVPVVTKNRISDTNSIKPPR